MNAVTMISNLPDVTAQRPQTGRDRLVVHVVRQFHPNRGGLEDVVLNLAQESLKAGWRVRVVTLNSLFRDRDTILPAREMLGDIEIVRIPWRGSTRYPVAPSVLSQIRDADLVHVHAIDFFFDFLALTKPLHRKKMIVTTHGGFFHTQKFKAIKTVWFNTLTRLSASAYSALVGCSVSDTRLFTPIARSTTMIENGANVDKFADAASTTPVRRMLTLGRFSSNKRLDRALDLLAELNRSGPAWHLDIVGMPADQTTEDVAAMAQARGVTDAMTIHVDLPQDAIARQISTNSFFVSASDYEGFGLVAIEAMSAGLVPILNANDAYRHLADRHMDIVLADFADMAATARATNAAFDTLVAQGPALRQSLIAAAQAYGWNRVAQSYLALYDRVLDA